MAMKLIEATGEMVDDGMGATPPPTMTPTPGAAEDGSIAPVIMDFGEAQDSSRLPYFNGIVVIRVLDLKFAPSAKGNPMWVTKFEIAAPDMASCVQIGYPVDPTDADPKGKAGTYAPVIDQATASPKMVMQKLAGLTNTVWLVLSNESAKLVCKGMNLALGIATKGDVTKPQTPLYVGKALRMKLQSKMETDRDGQLDEFGVAVATCRWELRECKGRGPKELDVVVADKSSAPY